MAGDATGISLAAASVTENRRNEIVQAAATLFDDVAYSRVSMANLAEATGLAKPTLYHYFRSKEEILYRIHHEFISILIERQRLRADKKGKRTDHLLSIMKDILELMETHRGHVRVFFEHHRELPEDWKTSVARERSTYQGMVEDVIQTGMEEGVYRETQVRLTALAVFGMCNWAYQWYRVDGPLRPDEIAEFFFDLLMRGLERIE